MKAKVIFILIFFIKSFASLGQVYSPLGSGFLDLAIVRSVFCDSVNGYVYAGGLFQQLGDSTPMKHISRWNGVQWDSLGSGAFGANVLSFAIFQDTLYAGGSFYSMGGLANTKALAKWDGSNWHSVAAFGPNDVIRGIKVLDNKLFILGSFEFINGIAASKIAAYDGNQWITFPTLDSDTSGWAISAAEIYNGELYVGGNFDSQIAPNMKDIAKWNGQAWVPVGNGLSGFGSSVSDLVAYKNELYVSGVFYTSFGDPGNNIIKWNGNIWASLGSGTDYGVWDMEVMNDELYIAGYFDNVNGIPASKFAKWDGNQWHYLNCFFSNAIFSISSMNGEMYIGGAFNIVNGITVNKVCKYTPAPVGVSEIESFDIKVFPNPADYVVSVIAPQSERIIHVSIIDITGKVITDNAQLINNGAIVVVSEIVSGIYILSVRTNSKEFKNKIIIQH